jgi:hypothetical protein
MGACNTFKVLRLLKYIGFGIDFKDGGLPSDTNLFFRVTAD